MLLVMKKPSSWMNSALPVVTTENTPSESLKDSNGLPNQRQRKDGNPPFIKMKQPVQFTRSRAYHKDDNAHIESRQGDKDSGSVTIV
jgi:hypothetical protein